MLGIWLLPGRMLGTKQAVARGPLRSRVTLNTARLGVEIPTIAPIQFPIQLGCTAPPLVPLAPYVQRGPRPPLPELEVSGVSLAAL